MQEGKKIWVESLLSPKEWKEQSKIFPDSYNVTVPYEPFECDFKWRYGMGSSLTSGEMTASNIMLDLIKREGERQRVEMEQREAAGDTVQETSTVELQDLEVRI